MNLHILMSARTWVTEELRADRNRTGVLIVTSETKKKNKLMFMARKITVALWRQSLGTSEVH